MSMGRRLVVFDWDGTLMDSTGVICRCLAHAFAVAGLPVRSEREYGEIIGLGLDEAFTALAPDADALIRDRVLAAYKDCFFSTDGADMPLFPGVQRTLAHLTARGHTLAVATGKSRRGLDRMLSLYPDLAPHLACSRCADESRSKPHPQMLEEIMAVTGVTPDQCLMVGDSVHDMDMARAAGVTGIGVTCGVHGRDRLMASGAIACIGTVADLPQWLAAEAPRAFVTARAGG